MTSRLVLLSLLAMAGVARADDDVVPDSYASIAYSGVTGAVGSTNHQPSLLDAARWAKVACGTEGCRSVLTFENQCGSVAAGSNRGLGWANAKTAEKAERKAKKLCDDAGNPDCSVVRTVCTFWPQQPRTTDIEP